MSLESPQSPFEAAPLPPSDSAGDALAAAVRLAMLGSLLFFAGVILAFLHEDWHLQAQVSAQSPAAEEAEAEDRSFLGLVAELQRLGQRYPDFRTNVLSHFNLPPLTNAPVKSR